MRFLYGKPLAQKVQSDIRKQTAHARRKPTLAVVLVGNDPASVNYVNRKGAVAELIGCGFRIYRLPASASETRIISLIERLNKNTVVNGTIVQLPLSNKIRTEKVLSAISPKKDVDNLRGDSPFVSPSVQAIWHLLSVAEKQNKKTKMLIVGYGRLIGKPLHAFLLQKGFSNIAVADSTTKNLTSLTAKTEVLISAVGKPNLIKEIKKGAVVIDAGAGFIKGKIKGDVDVARVSKLAKVITPVPGGVGPLTVVYLFKNVVLSMLKG